MQAVLIILLLAAGVSSARLPHSSRHLLHSMTGTWGGCMGALKDLQAVKTCERQCKQTNEWMVADCIKATGLADVKEVNQTRVCDASTGKCDDYASFLVTPTASADKSALQAAQAKCQKANKDEGDTCKFCCSHSEEPTAKAAYGEFANACHGQDARTKPDDSSSGRHCVKAFAALCAQKDVRCGAEKVQLLGPSGFVLVSSLIKDAGGHRF
jgi:hypothetical protein